MGLVNVDLGLCKLHSHLMPEVIRNEVVQILYKPFPVVLCNGAELLDG